MQALRNKKYSNFDEDFRKASEKIEKIGKENVINEFKGGESLNHPLWNSDKFSSSWKPAEFE